MARLPLKSPNWISYAAALHDAIDRFRSKLLAIAKLDEAFEARAVHCRIELPGAPPERVPDGVRVAVTIGSGSAEAQQPGPNGYFDTVITFDQLPPSWEDLLEISLDGQPRSGWLFLWKLDLDKYFCLPAGRPPKAPVRGQEIPENQGRPTKHKWEEIRAEIVRRCWKNGRLIAPESEQGFAEELQKWALHKLGKEPALSDMRTLVKHTIATLKLISQ